MCKSTCSSLSNQYLFTLKALAVLIAVATIATPLCAQTPTRRVALVIGNGSYLSNPLRNPPNDAQDVSEALKEAGFEVTVLMDAGLEAFEKAVVDFADRLKGADTGLFYYAGHGVQVDGSNYLLPVSPRIDDIAAVKAKAVAVDTIVTRMERSGVRTALVFLDSCRDNPFPGASRSGTRGLAVVPTPKTVNSMIAFATGPGDVAADGSGRNGVFSGAFLNQIKVPGQELSELMRKVKADVAAATANKQNPRVDDGMKEAFYFVSPEILAARAQSAVEASRAEVTRLEKELADRQALIAATQDSRARQTLELEQQRQQALATAARIEAENRAREAERQKRLAEEAAQAAARRAAWVEEQSRQQKELAAVAAARRAELERLAAAAASDNPDILIETVERLESAIREVDGQYNAVLKAGLDSLNASWDKQLAGFSGQKPDITETDAEFNARIAKEKAKLESDRSADLARLRSGVEAQRSAQTQAMRQQFEQTLNALQTKVWTITGSDAVLKVGEYDRNARLWPFIVESRDPMVPMLPVQVTADLNQAPDPKAAILALDAAVKAGALVAEIDWGITRDAANKRYAVDVQMVRVRNLSTDAHVASVRLAQRAAYFVSGKRNSPTAVRGTLQVTSASGVADVYINGKIMGKTPFKTTLAEGNYSVEVKWADIYIKAHKQHTVVWAGSSIQIAAIPGVFKIGDTGPAGGIIFYDKGSVSDGWRYLEAAPNDQSAGIQWSNGRNYDNIKTGTAIGTGKANTAAIIASQGAGSYAASLCRNLCPGGFNDWFLPSMDELDLMYTNLKKAGLGDFSDVWYWSSSQDDTSSLAWRQSFSDGEQYYSTKSISCTVRACRAF